MVKAYHLSQALDNFTDIKSAWIDSGLVLKYIVLVSGQVMSQEMREILGKFTATINRTNS